jgi:hypothetical protein
VVSQNVKEFVYKELNIFRQTIPSSGVAWNHQHGSPDDGIVSQNIQHVSPSAITIISTIHLLSDPPNFI